MPLGPGLHLVHKPVGPTSRVVLDQWRPPGFAWCHGGALDPFAEGLLLMLGGDASKLFEYLHAVPKVYVADIAWGMETDNGDRLGRPVAKGDPRLATPAALQALLPAFLGWVDQVPPATSNKRVGGVRAYRRAHRGEVFELPPARVYLHAAEWVGHRPGVSRLRLVCGGGYYVRALARDLGRAVGAQAHLVALHRTAIGPWTDPGRRVVSVTGRGLLPWMESLEVKQVLQGQLLHGTTRRPDWALPDGFPKVTTVRLLRGGRLVGVAEPREDGWVATRVFVEEV